MQYPFLFWLSATVLVSHYLPSVSAKCRGPWAIHACYGGNGKRSGPPPEPMSDDRQNGIFLRSILLRTNEQPKLGSNDMEDYLSVLPSEFESNEEESIVPVVRQNSDWTDGDLQALSKLVDEYIYRKKLRKMAGDEYI